MKKIMRKIRRVLRLTYNFVFTNKARIFTIRVILLSAWFRMRIRFIPMSRMEKSFGERGRESSAEDSVENMRIARRVGRRVERVCEKTTWDSKCLVRALVSQHILSAKDIHTTLYLGLRKEEDQSLYAHAWLRCGKLPVTGGAGHNDHTVVSMFYR